MYAQIRWVLIAMLLIYAFVAHIHCQQLILPKTQQIFELTNKVSLTNLPNVSSIHETSYILRTQLRINSIWSTAEDDDDDDEEQKQLLQVYFSDATISAPTATSKKRAIIQQINKFPDRPFYISLEKGKPSKVIAHTSRDQSLLNLERAIASLLQIRSEKSGRPIKETDISGRCQNFYAETSSTTTLVKRKKTDCSHWDLKVNYRTEKPLSVAQHSEEQTILTLAADSGGSLIRAESHETHRIFLEAKPDVGTQVISQLVLQHKSVGREAVQQLDFATLELAVESLLDWYRVFDIEADVDGALNELKQKELKNEIHKYSAQLSDEHIGRSTLASIFAELLPLARITKTSEFIEILQTHKALQPQLVDLLAAAQTAEAHAAIYKVFQTAKIGDDAEDIALLEKYLQSLAVGTHPERAIVLHLFEQLQHQKSEPTSAAGEHYRETLLLTLSASARQLRDVATSDPLLEQIRSNLLQELGVGCATMTDVTGCQTRYIRALHNLRDPLTIPTLLKYALDGANVPLSVAAMQALQSFPVTYYSEMERQAFVNIFYQRRCKYDTSARALALNILLSLRPSVEQLNDLLDYLASHDRQFELKTYTLQILRMFAAKCVRFRMLLRQCLTQRPYINNYHILAQKGLSTVLSRQLSQTPAFNESLLSVQEMYNGVLKRGFVELTVGAGGEEALVFKLGLFTNGLSYFVSDNDDATDHDDVEADDDAATVTDDSVTAGMEINVQGIMLRPLIFFNGQTELMGHIWSGTASEPTSAYRGTTLTYDHEHYIVLTSGATLHIRVLGAKSIDLNGQVEFSIWNRNAKTEIQQNSGEAVLGNIIVGFTYAQLENNFELLHEPKLSLKADIDFYTGVKLCMQLQRPEMILSHSNRRAVTLNATEVYTKKVLTKYAHKSTGCTLALNHKNNEMCNAIISDY